MQSWNLYHTASPTSASLWAMTEQPLLSGFVTYLQAALPDAGHVDKLMLGLPDKVYTDLSQHLAAELHRTTPEPLDVVLALPDGLKLAERLAEVLRLPLVRVQGRGGAWKIDPQMLLNRPSGLLVSRELVGGVAELEVCVRAQGLGCEVRSLACALERSTEQGRHRLLQLGVQSYAAVQIAQVPATAQHSGGWIIERRLPRGLR